MANNYPSIGELHPLGSKKFRSVYEGTGIKKVDNFLF